MIILMFSDVLNIKRLIAWISKVKVLISALAGLGVLCGPRHRCNIQVILIQLPKQLLTVRLTKYPRRA